MSEDTDLDALLKRVDPDRWLSSRFIGEPSARADVIAIYAFDHQLARAPKVASNPLLGEIRLTWWREALDEIYQGRPVRRHPGALALAEAVRRRALPREPLEAMIDARYRELDPTPMTEAEALDWARGTAGLAAELAAHILDSTQPFLAKPAGAAWALALRARTAPELAAAAEQQMSEAKLAAARLSVAAFPAVAHAVLAGHSGGELSRRLKVTWAVARGRI